MEMDIAMKITTQSALVASRGVIVCLSAWWFLHVGGCARFSQENKIKLAYVNWADATALTFLAEAILEEELGYDVDLTMADPAPVFTSVADGGHDAFLDAWLPITHARYMERFQDQLQDLGPNYEGTQIGLVVPDYVPVSSIEDLRGAADLFESQIIGIDSGAGIMLATENAIEKYDLDYTLLPSSEAAMTANLKDAIDRKRPIIVTGWRPHWKFARWQLRFLDDPQAAFARSENIHTVVRPGFVEEHPRAAQFLRQFRLNAEQLQELMDQLRHGDGRPQDIARAWVAAHPQVVARWLQGVERVR